MNLETKDHNTDQLNKMYTKLNPCYDIVLISWLNYLNKG